MRDTLKIGRETFGCVEAVDFAVERLVRLAQICGHQVRIVQIGQGSPRGDWFGRPAPSEDYPRQVADTSNSISSFFELRLRIAVTSTSVKPYSRNMAA